MPDNLCDKCGEGLGFMCTCKATPLEEAERKIDRLKNALLELLGIEHTKKALDEFELAVRLTPGIEEDKMRAMKTINTLRELL